MPMRYQYALTLKEQRMKNSEIAKILRCNVYTVTKMIKAAREANTGMVPSYPHSKRDEHARSLVKKAQKIQAPKAPAPISEPFTTIKIETPMSYTLDEVVCKKGTDGLQQPRKLNESRGGYFSRLVDSWTRTWSR